MNLPKGFDASPPTGTLTEIEGNLGKNSLQARSIIPGSGRIPGSRLFAVF